MSVISSHPVARLATVLRTVVELYRERNIPFLAGSVAYAAFVSLVPLLLLLVIAASILGGEGLRQSVLTATDRYLTPVARDIVGQSLSGTNTIGFSVLGGVALLWSVLKVFRTLDTAFSDIYQATADEGIVHQLRDGTIVFGAVTMAALTMIAVGAIVTFATPFSLHGSSMLLLRVLSYLALIVGLTVAFIPIYYVFPDVDVTLREVVPGAFVAAVGWALLQGLFQLYVSMTSAAELYGAIGAILLLITWLYFGAIVVLLGAAINVALFESGRMSRTLSEGPNV